MASIAEYRALIAQANTDIADYGVLSSAISGISSSIGETSSHLKSIGNKLTTALLIDGGAVDLNSFAEYATALSDMVSELGSIAASIPGEISALKEQITGWESAISSLEAAARAKKEREEKSGV